MFRSLFVCGMIALTATVVGCGTSEPVYVVDLNRVLDIFVQTLEEPSEDAPAVEGLGEDMEPVEENAEITDEFLKRFASHLNEAKLITAPIGVKLQTSGAIEGFVDSNSNAVQDGVDEKHLFELQVDAERSRLIASDRSGDEHYHRDRPYSYNPSGMFMGYMLGSMMNRQNGFANSTGIRPNFGSMQMSPQNYHSQAVSRSKAAASARSRVGSGGFRGGK